MTDSTLAAALNGLGTVPYPGEWPAPPFGERRCGDRLLAVIADDPGISVLGVDRADGSVWILPAGGAADLVNTGVDALVACSIVYAAARAEAEAMENTFDDDGDPDDEHDRGEEFADALIARFRAVDPAAVAHENTLWSVAAEELGYAIPL
ncbi:SUKH-4 family immunity protein [Nocardia thailandica]